MRNPIRKILKPNTYAKLKATVLAARSIPYRNVQTEYRYKLIQENGRNVFFGYYDLNQFSKDERKLLIHSVPKNADPIKDNADIALYDLNSNSISSLATTHTWCWQQGSRLRWHPIIPEQILFNDLIDGSYKCRVFDIEVRTDKEILPFPIYDFDSDFSYGLSLNFSRLQRLRPGYGYYRIVDSTIDQDYPDEDGIIKYDIRSGKSSLLISLSQLASDVRDKDLYFHYINHISISPSGKNFMFFHLMAPKHGGDWKTRLMVCDNDGNNLKVLEDKYKVSHYCWRNNKELIVTCYKLKKQFYNLYNIETMEVDPFYHEIITRDGHPSCFFGQNKIITDTYPDRSSFQDLYVVEEGRKKQLARLYHNPYMGGEKRCDLHPRLAPSENMISVDTTCRSGRRSCMIIDLMEKEGI